MQKQSLPEVLLLARKSLKSRQTAKLQTGICPSGRNFFAFYCFEIFTGQRNAELFFPEMVKEEFFKKKIFRTYGKEGL